MTTEEALTQAKIAMIWDIDRDCENTARYCFTCTHNSKCKVIHIKEALCMIDGGSKCMHDERFVQLRNWAIEYYRKSGGI